MAAKVTSSEHANIEHEDPRLQAVTTVAADTVIDGQQLLKGAPVKAVTLTTYRPGAEIAFGIPNMAALFLHYSLRLYTEAEEGFQSDRFLALGEPLAANDGELFDLLEKRIGSIVFAYTSLESFANSAIPDGFTWKQERQDKKCIETYDKEQTERWLSLKVKLDQVLPHIYGIGSPSGTRVWNDFIQLERLRNRLIHLKAADLQGIAPDRSDADAIWHVLVRPEIPNPVAQALKTIGHYVESSPELPRWYAKFPEQ